MMEKLGPQEGGEQPRPEDLPEWAKNMSPEQLDQLRRAFEGMDPEQLRKAMERMQPGKGEPREGRDGEEGSEGGPEGSGPGDKRKAGDGVGDHGIEKLDVEGKDSGKGERDPNSKEEPLDPDKARNEKAGRDLTGREGTSEGVNRLDDIERLPRKYREAAKKYFEKDPKSK
jgi:hypothetical protein